MGLEFLNYNPIFLHFVIKDYYRIKPFRTNCLQYLVKTYHFSLSGQNPVISSPTSFCSHNPHKIDSLLVEHVYMFNVAELNLLHRNQRSVCHRKSCDSLWFQKGHDHELEFY